MNKVDILLAPYEYVLNSVIRKSIKLNLNETIIVFDEGHHANTIAENSCSNYL